MEDSRKAGNHAACHAELRTTRERYRALMEATGAVVWRSAADLGVEETRGWTEITGQPPEWAVAQGWLEAIHPEDKQAIRSKIDALLVTPEPGDATYRLRHADGSYRWVHARVVPVKNPNGTVREWLGILKDINDQLEADTALRKGEERLRLALETADIGIWDYDIGSARGLCSPTKSRILGIPDDYPMGPEAFIALIHPDDRTRVEDQIGRSFQVESGGHFTGEFRIVRAADRQVRWVRVAAQMYFDATGRPTRSIGTIIDTTEHREQQDQLYRLAHYDQLTELPNRRLIWDRLQAVLEQGQTVSLIMLDLDGFKQVNDSFGHHAGDLLLQEVARRLRECLPASALVGRVGGDEFVVVLPECAAWSHIEPVVQTIHARLARPFCVLNRTAFLGTSVGIAIAPQHGLNSEELMANADLALYEAKAAGRNETHVFTPALRQGILKRQELSVELRVAFERGEFELFYQPQVRLRDRRIVGAEGLLRWNHPTRGVLSPGAFLSVLKTSPIAVAVGEWTIGTACSEAAQLKANGHEVRVAVNAFSAQFRGDLLVKSIERALSRAELSPHLLELEITEHVIIKNDDTIAETLRKLKELGINIAFDDYGTGYASLSMLKGFPLTKLKIDRSFVANIQSSDQDRAVVKAIVALARSFGLEVTAEGIEDERQHRIVRGLGCSEGQGYLYGRPMSSDAFRTMLAAQSGVERGSGARRAHQVRDLSPAFGA